MSARWPEGERDVIPRWRDPRSTAARKELSPICRSQLQSVEPIGRSDREADWQQNRSLGFALDLVGTALVVGVTPAARDAAKFVLKQEKTSSLARIVAERVVREGGDEQLRLEATPSVREQVHELRTKLGNDPRNALGWTELARYYTIAGLRPQANHAMKIALGLAPNHRYVLRAAARLAVHHGKFDEALFVISGAQRTPSDPWLVASELAIAGPAEARPRLTKHARSMLGGGQFSPTSTTELASALGTMEFRAGSNRKARRLIESSLEAPNDNAIAQGQWISRELQTIEVDAALLDESAEARALRHGAALEWEAALEAAWDWHRDQPFASGPGELGSYHASLGGAYAEGAKIAEEALRANPREFLLSNNLAFCLLNLGEIQRATEVLDSIDVGSLAEHQLSTFYATSGLLRFRSGDPVEGRTLYLRSISLTRDSHHRAIAQIMLAAEELRLKSPTAEKLIREALLASEEVEGEDIRFWLRRLTP